MTFIDRPTSHAVAHAEGQACPCHGKTETEIAAPYAAFAFSLPVLALIVLILGWVMS